MMMMENVEIRIHSFTLSFVLLATYAYVHRRKLRQDIFQVICLTHRN